MPHNYVGFGLFLIWKGPASHCTDQPFANSQWRRNIMRRLQGEFQARLVATAWFEQRSWTIKQAVGLRFNNLVYLLDVTDRLRSAFNFGWRKRVQKLTKCSVNTCHQSLCQEWSSYYSSLTQPISKLALKLMLLKSPCYAVIWGTACLQRRQAGCLSKCCSPWIRKPPELGFEASSSNLPSPKLRPELRKQSWAKQEGAQHLWSQGLLKEPRAPGIKGSGLRLLLVSAHLHRLLRPENLLRAAAACEPWGCRCWPCGARGCVWGTALW